LDAGNGEFRWSYLTGGMVVSSPAIANGVAYVGSYDHFVYAIGSFTGSQAGSEPWPAWLIAAVAVIVALIVIVGAFILKLLNNP
jgi:outer membrane protein assembly factor BamB